MFWDLVHRNLVTRDSANLEPLPLLTVQLVLRRSLPLLTVQLFLRRFNMWKTVVIRASSRVRFSRYSRSGYTWSTEKNRLRRAVHA